MSGASTGAGLCELDASSARRSGLACEVAAIPRRPPSSTGDLRNEPISARRWRDSGAELVPHGYHCHRHRRRAHEAFERAARRPSRSSRPSPSRSNSSIWPPEFQTDASSSRGASRRSPVSSADTATSSPRRSTSSWPRRCAADATALAAFEPSRRSALLAPDESCDDAGHAVLSPADAAGPDVAKVTRTSRVSSDSTALVSPWTAPAPAWRLGVPSGTRAQRAGQGDSGRDTRTLTCSTISDPSSSALPVRRGDRLAELTRRWAHALRSIRNERPGDRRPVLVQAVCASKGRPAPSRSRAAHRRGIAAGCDGVWNLSGRLDDATRGELVLTPRSPRGGRIGLPCALAEEPSRSRSARCPTPPPASSLRHRALHFRHLAQASSRRRDLFAHPTAGRRSCAPTRRRTPGAASRPSPWSASFDRALSLFVRRFR